MKKGRIDREEQGIEQKEEQKSSPIGPVTLPKIVVLFVLGGIFGLLLEGAWYLHIHHRWESHVTTMVLPLCGIYSVGFVGCYVGCCALQKKPLWLKFVIFALAGAAFEFFCGLLLEKGLDMRAWNYSKTPLNIRGHVNLAMTLLWGSLGVIFSFLVPRMEGVLRLFSGKAWRAVCLVLGVVVVLDMLSAAVCITRWSNRHRGKPPANAVSRYIDTAYDDEFMSQRFMEWRFIKKTTG